ncbi:uncharacterized protein K452DRAFT_243261 [Aplosporella prunicola CBS 121167]|uniref:Zinc finger PHD-type domain-containing protein n=1 Tax=Aplosporella prunicola CBS 121167 TaxID=1176127 RepID=A0A6A6BMP5_9PEZI|nr:uncharacterized protein K452DRAFT_243261 [Aplosporella prunicola CBS 121167]KAF2145336.1 hypothetical protein K452DRAFT_243261 [Aplosporella prunicola CBS 121167]
MPARKRARDDAPQPPEPREPSKLEKLRNMWEYTSVVQYIYIFGSAVKIDEDIDIDEFEAECLKPAPSEMLAQIGLALLKFVSSHRGLTLEIFDEYTRRQFVAKAPHRNPYGTDEVPKKFDDFDTFTKIRVLHQLSTWTLNNADRIRERMPEKDAEQTQWRVDPIGWDSEDRTYFVFDDDRLYRRTDPPLPAAPKAKAKPRARKGKPTRGTKRRKLSTPPQDSAAEDEDEEDAVKEEKNSEPDTFGGYKWECIAVTLEEYQNFVSSIRRSRDPNEKALVKSLEADVMPVLEKRAEQQRAKALRKQKELENLEKLAHAKRSSRIAGRMEKQKELQMAEEAEKKRVADLEMAKKEQEKQHNMEEARESRMMTREQRLKEREVRRILHEEELKKLEDRSRAESNEARLSERHLKAEMARRQKELEKMAQEEDNWVFDCCVCGVHGENLDDGTHSIACEKCNVWQHSACHGIAQSQAERDDFHFVCGDCKRKSAEVKKEGSVESNKTDEAAQPKLPPLKLRIGASASPKSHGDSSPTKPSAVAPSPSKPSPSLAMTFDFPPRTQPSPNGLLNGPSLSPHGQSSGPPGLQRRSSGYSSHSTLGESTPVLPKPQPNAGIYGSNPFMSGAPQFPLPSFNHGQPYSNGLPQGAPSPSRPTPQAPGQEPMDPQRPSSSGYGAPSPVKAPSFSSPYQPNGHPIAAPFSSPNTSFQPPLSAQRPSFSPMKQASSPPQQHSTPSQRPVDTSSDLLPEPSTGISPEKHDSAKPTGSHDISETPVLPPVAPLAPSTSPTILTPPSKKMTPERPRVEGLPASAATPAAAAAVDVSAYAGTDTMVNSADAGAAPKVAEDGASGTSASGQQ